MGVAPPGVLATDLADFEEPSRAAAAAGPAVEKLATVETSSTGFLDLKSPPRKPSFSFFFRSLSLESLSLSFLSFLENSPSFFSFSSRQAWLTATP